MKYLTKITPPKSMKVVPRNRLFRLIDDSPGRIVWISASAGAGKTTLTSSYVASRRRPCLWYHMDSGDSDPSTLFHYMALALQRARPRLRAPLTPPAVEHFEKLDIIARRYFERLFSLLAGSGNSQAAMVLDDFQNVDESTHHLLTIVLGLVPENLRIIVLSRLSPPPCFARLQALDVMSVIDGEALRFSKAEAKAFFDLLPLKERLPEETIRDILQRCQGWVAGLRLMAAAADNFGATRSFRTMPRENIFGYFLNELFAMVSEQIRIFLMQTAFLPTMTAGMSQRLTGMDSSSGLLHQLIANNFFITQYPGQELTYRYHPLFREFLLEQARSRFTPDDLDQVVRKAAGVLRDTDHLEDAAALYVHEEYWEELAKLVLEMSPVMLQKGLQEALVGWHAFLPPDMYHRHPWLHYWKALALLPRDVLGARECIENALREFIHRKDTTGIMLADTEAILILFMEFDDFSRIEPHYLRLSRLVTNEFRFSAPDVEARAVMSMVLSCIFCCPDHPDRQRWISRAEELLHAAIPVHQKIPLGFHLQIFHLYMGNMADAGRIHAKIKSMAGLKTLSNLNRLQWLVMDATNAHLVDYRADHCRAGVEIALAMAEAAHIRIFDILLLLIAGYAAVNQGDHAELTRLKERLEPLIPGANAFDASNYHCLLSCEHLGLGEPQGAMHHAQLALDAIPAPKTPFLHILALIGLAEACIEGDQQQKARAFLKQARRLAVWIPGFKGDILFLMPAAYAAFRRKQDKVGLRVLRKAFACGRTQGWTNTVFWRPRQLSLLCVKALEAGLEEDYVWMLVQRHRLWDRLPAALQATSPPDVEIAALGSGLSIKRDGVELVTSGDGSQKTLSMLKALIVSGGRNVSELRLMDMLWPEAEGDKAKQNFKFTLHSLRKLLGAPNTVKVKAKTVTLNPRRCRVDVFVFEHACALAEEARRELAPPKKKMELLEKAISLYSGDFLPQDSTPWVITNRQNLHRRFQQAVERLEEFSL